MRGYNALNYVFELVNRICHVTTFKKHYPLLQNYCDHFNIAHGSQAMSTGKLIPYVNTVVCFLFHKQFLTYQTSKFKSINKKPYIVNDIVMYQPTSKEKKKTSHQV